MISLSLFVSKLFDRRAVFGRGLYGVKFFRFRRWLKVAAVGGSHRMGSGLESMRGFAGIGGSGGSHRGGTVVAPWRTMGTAVAATGWEERGSGLESMRASPE